MPRSDGAVGSVTRDHSIVTLALSGTTVPVHCLIGLTGQDTAAVRAEIADLIV